MGKRRLKAHVNSHIEMKKLPLNNEYSSVDNFRSLISGFIDELEIDSYKNEQKKIELCHVGKFLMFFENQ